MAAFEKAVELDGSNHKAKHNADQLALSLRRRARSSRDNDEGAFGSLNRIDTSDDFDELASDGVPPAISRS